VDKSLLEQELAPLNAQIEQVRGTLARLEGEMRAAEAELETFSADRQRFDALREACNVLDRLAELQAGQLFWGEVPGGDDPAGHIARMRSRIAGFDEEIRGVLERQAQLKAEINQRLDELDCLDDEVHNTYARDERREEEFVVERELSEIPDRESVMPWSHDGEVERRYRRAMSTAMLLSLLLTIVVRMVTLPPPVHPVIVEVPERLAMMVRKEVKKPEPVKPKEEKKEEKKEAKTEEKKAEKAAEKKEEKKHAVAQEKPAPDRPRPAAVEQTAAPKKSQNTGVLAFKESFKDLLDETPVPKLGAEARLSSLANNAAGQAQGSRSLVTIAGGAGGAGGYAAVSRNVGNGGSGGIGSAAVSRRVGGGGGKDGRLGRGDAGFAQVKSGISGPGGAKEGRPLSSSARPARTDEEIQILFDRYKAALYRIYNTQLRKDPTLRGKMVLRIAIEPSGAVSACAVESTNMNATEFCDQIVERVRKFNFGPKDGVPRTTILYPIDFLPSR